MHSQGRLLQPYSVLPRGSRHPVRHISFNSHSLITANVPYEKVVRNSDMDNFACHRRSVRVWAHPEKWLSVVASVPPHPIPSHILLSGQGTQ